MKTTKINQGYCSVSIGNLKWIDFDFTSTSLSARQANIFHIVIMD